MLKGQPVNLLTKLQLIMDMLVVKLNGFHLFLQRVLPVLANRDYKVFKVQLEQMENQLMRLHEIMDLQDPPHNGFHH